MNVDIKNDGVLDIAVGLNAKVKVWKNKKIQWSELLERLSRPVVTPETHKQFMAASKQEQQHIKDVGGFVGGYLVGGKRDKQSVKHRQLLTLDIDFSHENMFWDFSVLYDCAAAIHSTHKSSPTNLRHRLIVPLDRPVTPDEYQAIARRVASDCGMDYFDPSTFDVNRLMFWPSVSIDSEYYYRYIDGPFLSADGVLSTYDDWRDVSQWPVCGDFENAIAKEAKKQEDPLAKKGIIGLFCRAYTIDDAIALFLSDDYAPAGEGRYTYSKGSTAAGLVVYEGKFAYSHHGTDPSSGVLCNAFDLVRLHKFGALDIGKEGAKESMRAMERFASDTDGVKKQIALERREEAKIDFADGVDCAEKSDDTEWLAGMQTNGKGAYENTSGNINLILRNDSHLKGAFRLNTFDNKRYVFKSLPWRVVEGCDLFKDVDYAGVRNYIECVYGITSSQKVDDALSLEFERAKYHPIRDYLNGLVWDGTQRVDSLLIDYFGAEDSPYTRAAIRKMLCAAVARAYCPGTKFDAILILVGEQGTYKSTFVRKLGGEWFSDTFTTVQGREAYEQIQGAWIVEVAELSGLKKAEIETIKHYISKCADSFRPAYGRVVETYKRQCVFFGTTNSRDFLRDPTGNRRFMPVDVHPERAVKSVADDLTDAEIEQIWAEACEMYRCGETLYLSEEEENIARREQRRHAEVDERRGVIEEYLDAKYPSDWDGRDLNDRRNWLDDPLASQGTLRKELVCIAEIWCECLGKDKKDMSRYNTREINDIMRSLDGWEFVAGTHCFPIYGKQRFYRRKKAGI